MGTNESCDRGFPGNDLGGGKWGGMTPPRHRKTKRPIYYKGNSGEAEKTGGNTLDEADLINNLITRLPQPTLNGTASPT